MPNGKPHDHPVTDTVIHDMHPFPPELEQLVRDVHARNPRVFDDLEWAPFDWEQGKHVPEALALLRGLLEHHGDPIRHRELIDQYRRATR